MLKLNFPDILYTLPAILIALTFHEFSHGFAAYILGDNTAKEQGRLSLNPIKHIDPIGFFALLFFRFGWAKPVPYNPLYFKNRKLGTFIVAFAGPFSNLLLAFLSLSLILIIRPQNMIIYNIINLLVFYNIIFAIFNLIPIPPLDGSKLIASILPNKQERLFWEYERFGYPILLILIVTGLLSKIISPLIQIVLNKLLLLANFFFGGL